MPSHTQLPDELDRMYLTHYVPAQRIGSAGGVLTACWQLVHERNAMRLRPQYVQASTIDCAVCRRHPDLQAGEVAWILHQR